MKQILVSMWREDDGVLSFEWTIVGVVIVFGVVSGLSAARDVIIDELGDLSQAVVAFDQSFTYSGIVSLGIPGSSYNDVLGTVTDCSRQPVGSWGIPPRFDIVGGG